MSTLARHPRLALFGLALLTRVALGLLFHQPGYTDAYYYTDLAAALRGGRGFTDDFVWNYLGTAPGVTGNPGGTYWFPLTAVLVWASQSVFGPSFFAAQLPHMLLSALYAPLAYGLARSLAPYVAPYTADPTVRAAATARTAWLAGALAAFPGIYAPYLSLPDNFAAYGLFSYGALRLGGLALSGARRAPLLALGAGVCIGLAFLTRADGLLLLPALAVAGFLPQRHRDTEAKKGNEQSTENESNKGSFNLLPRSFFRSLCLCASVVISFLAVASPWLWHNAAATGQLAPGGAAKTIFLRGYDDLFSATKTFDLNYLLNRTDPALDWGIGPLVLSKLAALWQNGLLVARPTLFVMLPLLLVGLAVRPVLPDVAQTRLWRRRDWLPFVVYALGLWGGLSLVFTFPSTRGSVFHSGTALLIPIFAASALGLDRTVGWVSRKARNPTRTATTRARRYGWIAIGTALAVSVAWTLILAGSWDADYSDMRQAGDWLAHNAPPETRTYPARDGLTLPLVMVADAPAYNYANTAPAIAISSDPLAVDRALAQRYGATYMVVQARHAPDALTPLATTPPPPGFRLVARFGTGDAEMSIYKIAP